MSSAFLFLAAVLAVQALLMREVTLVQAAAEDDVSSLLRKKMMDRLTNDDSLTSAIRERLEEAELGSEERPGRGRGNKYPVRTITLVNACSKPITTRFNGGALAGLPNGTSYSCTSNKNCNELFKTTNPLFCDMGTPTASCHFALDLSNIPGVYNDASIRIPSKRRVTIRIPRKPVTVGIPQKNANGDIVKIDLQNTTFSGGVVAATNCTMDGIWDMCKTGTQVAGYANVNGVNTQISYWAASGTQDRPTLVEFSLFYDRADTYDISLLNGYNLPAKLSPNKGSFEAFTGPSENIFQNCTAIGGAKDYPSPAPTGCPWKFNLSALEYPVFAKILNPEGLSAMNCSTDADCPASQSICGMTFKYQVAQYGFFCGTKISSLLMPDGFCQVGPPLSLIPGSTYPQGSIQCSSTVNPANPTQQLSDTQANLFGCKGAYDSSPYNPAPGLQICGYPPWANGIVEPNFRVQSNSPTLGDPTPSWEESYTQSAMVFKKACPQAYTYPYDDPTSTFTCGPPQGQGINTASYTITFCPEGKAGTTDPW